MGERKPMMGYVIGQLGRAEILRRHATRAAQERYGGCDEETKIQLRRLIRRSMKIMAANIKRSTHVPRIPPATRVSRSSMTRRSVWLVGVNGTDYRVVYEEPTDRLVTFLPLVPDKHRASPARTV